MLRRLLPLLGIALWVLVGSAQARRLDDPIVGSWNFGGGVVQVTSSGTGFTGTIVKATQFSDCVHPVGEVIWRITPSGTSYTGTHAWFASPAPECKLGGLANRGQSTWSIVESGSSLLLHFCTTNPTNGADTRCSDLTRAKPVAPAWPALPDALVSLESVSNGCGGGVASNERRLGDTSTYLNSNNPFGKRYVVNFRLACNLHDAGYSGAKVRDPIDGGIIDYFGWSQKGVDDKFLRDMRRLCDQAFAGTGATVALADCRGRGGKTSFGAETRYNFVRQFGHRFYRARPNLNGLWSGPGLTGLVITQKLRSVRGTWRQGDLSGEFRGTLISRDQDSVVQGFVRTTVNGETKQSAIAITADPDRPKELVVDSSLLHATLRR